MTLHLQTKKKKKDQIMKICENKGFNIAHFIFILALIFLIISLPNTKKINTVTSSNCLIGILINCISEERKLCNE